MNTLLILLLITIIGQSAASVRKAALNWYPGLDDATIIWVMYVAGLIFATLNMARVHGIKSSKSWIDVENKGAIKWLVLASLIGFIYMTQMTPMIKSLQLANLSTIKGPLAMIVAVLSGIFFLNEKVGIYTWISVVLFFLASIVASCK